MIAEWIAFGGLLHMALLGLLVLFLMAIAPENGADDEPIGWATFLAGAFIALTVAFTDMPAFGAGAALAWIAGWVVAGSLWTTLRWYLLLRRVRAFAAGYEGAAKQFDTDLRYKFGFRSWPPRPGDISSTLWFWLLFWPVDAPAQLVGRPLRRLYRLLATLFATISDRMFAGISRPEES